MQLDTQAAVVVLSGGQDSATCLAWALRAFAHVEAVTFDYGQRHRVELDAAAAQCAEVGIEQKVVPVSSLAALGGTTMIGSDDVDVGAIDAERELPNTFVPGRNVLFLTLAAAYAYQRGIANLVTGVCETDYSGYPDCRAETMAAVQNSICAGMDASFTIHTPLMHLDKAATVALAKELHAESLLALSHTCYNGQVPPCGQCPACVLRAKGFAEAGMVDPLLARLQAEA